MGEVSPRVVRLCGAPATGKSWLRSRLAMELGLPAFGITEERERLTRPGRWWPDDDRQAWANLRAKLAAVPVSIVETSGLSANDAVLFRGVRLFTVYCTAALEVRRRRLIERVSRRSRADARKPNYVADLLASVPAVRADARWDSSAGTGGAGALAGLVDRIRRFLEEP